MTTEETNKKNNVGLSVRIDNWSVLRSSENFWTKYETGFEELKEIANILNKIANRGKIYGLLILDQQNELKEHKNSEQLATLFNINCKDKKNRIKKVKKTMIDLYPIVTFDYDKIKGSKEWHYRNIKINLYESTYGFTQLPCDLLRIPNIKLDHLVIFTILNYYKTKHNNLDINPSHKTIAKLAGCSEKKVYTLLEEGKKLNIWKYESHKGVRATNIYNISYLNNEGMECYYFRDELNRIEMEKDSLKEYLKMEKVENL